jgi:hypothetical protein
MDNKTETFVHDGREVKLTGRKATKQGIKDKTFELVEITPIDGINDYKLWVREIDLYKIVGN